MLAMIALYLSPSSPAERRPRHSSSANEAGAGPRRQLGRGHAHDAAGQERREEVLLLFRETTKLAVLRTHEVLICGLYHYLEHCMYVFGVVRKPRGAAI